MTDLITRIQAGDGDNAEVLAALGFDDIAGGTPDQPTVWGNGADYHVDPKPLDSVDDALRLVPEGVNIQLDRTSDGEWVAALRTHTWKIGRAPTAARALVCAILRTKENT